MVKKRSLLWDYTNTQGVPWMMDKVNFNVISSVSNWNAWVPPELNHRAPFRPMVRTEGQLSGQDWQFIEASRELIIHFFNEPERQGISPEAAADIWKRQMWPLKSKGHKLVSPSCSNDQNGQNWINKWMSLVEDHPPDYLGLHYYGIDGNALIKYVEDMHHRYPQHQIYLSEWASISRDYKHVLQMTVQCANWLDSQSFIFEHGLFGCQRKLADNFVSPAAQLMHPDGSFTDLFMKYQSEVPMRDDTRVLAVEKLKL